jgi:hypothetical protein
VVTPLGPTAKGHHTQSLPRHRDVTDTVSLAGDCSAEPG